MPKSGITINEIASALGISKSTVSRALRDSYDVNPATRNRVKEFADRHDYRPDFMAQSLKSGSSKTIGVIVPAYNIPFYAEAICGIQDYAIRQGYNVMVCHSKEQYNLEVKNVEALLSANVDGIIMSVARDTARNEHIHNLKRKKVPLVLFNRVIENFKAAKVVVNDYYGALNMVRFLIGTGCRKIAHIAGPANLMLCGNRKAGYLDALKEHGIEPYAEFIREGDFTIDSGRDCMKQLMETGISIDAVFCVCDAVAFGAMRVIKQQGLIIPDDISVAGFTDEPMAELVEPSLTTVRQPIYKIGETAARLLFAQLNNPDLPAELSVLDTKIIVRESTRRHKEIA
jgi:LacI family transcriptional regulator